MPATTLPRREVVYVHHTRDKDLDVLLLFRDLTSPDPAALIRSSPVLAVRRTLAAVFDAEGRGDLVSVEVNTANTTYTLTMPWRLFLHLQREIVGVGWWMARSPYSSSNSCCS
jgi:hypothetical protein